MKAWELAVGAVTRLMRKTGLSDVTTGFGHEIRRHMYLDRRKRVRVGCLARRSGVSGVRCGEWSADNAVGSRPGTPILFGFLIEVVAAAWCEDSDFVVTGRQGDP